MFLACSENKKMTLAERFDKARKAVVRKTKAFFTNLSAAFATTGLVTASVAVSNLVVTVYATGSETTELVTRVKNIAGQIYSLIVGISSVTAAVIVAYCLLTMMLSKDERKVGSAMDWLKRAIVCWVAIFLVSNIFNWLIANLNLSSGTGLNING